MEHKILRPKQSPLVIEAPTIAEAVQIAVNTKQCLRGVVLQDVCLRGVDFSNTDLSMANFWNSDLIDANFSGCNLTRTSLTKCNLACAIFDNTEMYHADLSGAMMYRTKFITTDASNCSFNRANLSCVVMQNTSLCFSKFEHARIHFCTFDGVDIMGIHFRGTSITSSLAGARIGTAALWNVRSFVQLGLCGEFDRETLAFFFADGSEPQIRCGCFTGTPHSFKTEIQKKYRTNSFHQAEYLALAEHIEKLYAAQLEKLYAENKES